VESLTGARLTRRGERARFLPGRQSVSLPAARAQCINFFGKPLVVKPLSGWVRTARAVYGIY
jgi:hypothetical protein